VRGYIYDMEAAGGHQIYGCLGLSQSQARPLHVGLYGLPHEQARFTPVMFHFHFNRYLPYCSVYLTRIVTADKQAP